MIPGYLQLSDTGELAHRIELLTRHYRECSLCPHQCRVDRLSGSIGICRSGPYATVASSNIHTGEEPPISGYNGSGTIFFSGCSGRCIFCQNYPISQLNTGKQVSDECLAEMMLDLQNRGCHNINLVTPTHYLPSIVSALSVAADRGLHLPLVYNTSGYERVEIIKLLEGIVDIYLPDIKYTNNDIASEISGFSQYTQHNQKAIKEMYRQVGNLKIEDGVAVKGIVIRHLILPEDMSGTYKALRYLACEISPDIHISLMDQYFPAYKAHHHKRLSRRITVDEYEESIGYFDECGLHNGWIQEHFSG
ncbi:radical SAM protein [Candidatus Omnitrophota bacterium]